MTEKLTLQDVRRDGIIEHFEKGHLDVYTLGKPLNGRLLYSTPSKAEELYPGSSILRHELLKVVSGLAEKDRVKTVAVLRVDEFNAGITTIDELNNNESESLDYDVVLIRGDDETFFNDGIVLQEGEGAIIVTGDCHTIVAWSNNPHTPVVAAHAGRNSLHNIGGHKHIDNVPSITNTIVDKMNSLGVKSNKIHLRIIAGIGAKNFDHPLNHETYGPKNTELIQYFAGYGGADINDDKGHIDIAKTITGQLTKLGIPPENISHDNLDTYTDEKLWSNRSGDLQRNPILIFNKPTT